MNEDINFIFIIFRNKMGMNDKQILVTKDPVFVNKNIIDGRYIGKRPSNFYYLSHRYYCVKCAIGTKSYFVLL